MKRNRIEKDSDNFSLLFYSMIVVALIIAELINYVKYSTTEEYFSDVAGVIGWIAIYLHSQRIVNNNLFLKFTYLGLTILAISLIKQAVSHFSKLPLFFAGVPLLFVAYFRLLILIFFKDYPNRLRKPTVIFASPIGFASFQGKNEKYIPSVKEKIFSILFISRLYAFDINSHVCFKKLLAA